jgi:hypothetical protein
MIDTNQALQAVLLAGQSKVTAFPPTSRYYGIDTATVQIADGRTVIYLRRRFIPSPDKFALLQLHIVTQGERLDNITAEQFWRVCDANRAMRPEELTETVGREIRITLPEGIPATPNA